MYRVEAGIPTSPVTLQEAKQHLRVDHDDEDSLIESLLISSTQYGEGYQRRFYARRQISVYHDSLPLAWRVPFAPVVSVDSLEIDGLSVTCSLTSSGWLMSDSTGEATIVMTVGYDSEDIPATVKQAILLLIGHWYQHREAADAGRNEIPFGVGALLDMGRVY